MQAKPFEPVRIGVVGLGRFGRLHSLTVAGLAEAELVAVVARRQASVDALLGELPGVRGWLDLEQAVEESHAEAWIVACTTASHIPVTKTLLAAGKTVLLEKPIADNLAHAESLATLVRPDSSNLMIGHIVLFNSEYLQLRDEAAQRGKIHYVNCVRHRPASILSSPPYQGGAKGGYAGENPLHAVMVHDLYATSVLIGRADPVGYSAQYHRTDSGAIDLALAQLQWPDGAVASFAASYMTPTGMAPRGFDRMEIFGDGWAARINPNPRPLEVWDGQAHWPLALEIRAGNFGPTGMMAEELRAFCHVVRGLQCVSEGATYADGLQMQRWMDRLEASAAS